MRFTTSDEIVTGLELIMDELGNEDLLRVFKNWKIRLNWVIDNNGEYYHT